MQKNLPQRARQSQVAFRQDFFHFGKLHRGWAHRMKSADPPAGQRESAGTRRTKVGECELREFPSDFSSIAESAFIGSGSLRHSSPKRNCRATRLAAICPLLCSR
jgi:hypothetical protein